MKRQLGFTLIELIVVIVILGILAATAVPRFVDLQSDARASVMKGIAASMNTSKELVRARWLANGSGTSSTVSLDGTTSVTTQTASAGADAGTPIANTGGIITSITVPTEVTCVPGAATAVCTYTGYTGCTATYTLAGAAVTTAATSTTCR